MSSTHFFRACMWSLVVLCALTVSINVPVVAQERVGGVTGVAKDPSGGVLPDVTVTITNSATNRVVTVRTRGDGTYAAVDLEPGRYSIRFEKTGFSRYELPDVIVLLGRTIKVDAAMQVGALEQVVQVTEAAPLIDTQGTTIAHNVSSDEFSRMPKGRDFLGIAFSSPSVTTGAIEGGYQVNGASGAENNYYIDGVSTTSVLDGRARQTSVFEHIQEVQVKTGGMEAEYGGALGGVISAVTKSGGNQFHGDVHYYFFGDRIGASDGKRLNLDPADEKTVRYIQDSKQKLDYHEFGGSLGGPILKNKLWFFTSISPRWRRASFDYLFSNGKEPDTLDNKRLYQSWFNKLSYDPSSRVRTNFTWLYTPTRSMGNLPAYGGSCPNCSTTSKASAQPQKTRGWSQPEQSYTGNVDVTVTNTSLLSFRGGRYYLNYKDVGIPNTVPWQYQTSGIGLPFSIPSDLQLGLNATNTPRVFRSVFDITTRTYGQADYSQFANFFGTHNLKLGTGVQKNINKVNQSYGDGGYVFIFWDTAYRTGDRGQYGYYEVNDAGEIGSTGASIYHVYLQDQWRVHSRLTISAGLRMEHETVPSYWRDVKDYAFKFTFAQKRSPRLGASFDVFGNGKMKVYGSWGRYYDWTKYELSRGTFGGAVWRIYYRTLDTLDINSLNLTNMPGRNLWQTGVYRNRRVPGFQYLDPNIKPMSADLTNFGVEYEIAPQMVFAARYVHNNLIRTIEDIGALDAAGDEVYRYGNPGEGAYVKGPVSGATCETQVGETCAYFMPKPKRQYDAMELSLTRRFGGGWFMSGNYVFSRLYGNYAGLQSTDEIRPDSLGYGFGPSQVSGADIYRPGGNVNRYWDLDEAVFEANGKSGLLGRLPTDRPHVFKLYGSKQFKWGTEVGTFFHVMSGTPVTTQVVSVNDIPLYVNGRGDMGRTPVFTRTDLMVAHELRMGESKKLRFEVNMQNLFNQKISQFIFDRYNREEHSESAGIDLIDTDLTQGFDWKKMVAETPDGLLGKARDSRYGMKESFSPGFNARFLIKFIF